MTDSSLFLFIIWEKSRYKTEEILNDLKKKYVIRSVYNIKWSQENFLKNLQRFYGKSLPDAQKKANVCGTGAFLAVVISDPNPKFNVIKHDFKEDYVNSNVNQSKKK